MECAVSGKLDGAKLASAGTGIGKGQEKGIALSSEVAIKQRFNAPFWTQVKMVATNTSC